MYMFTLLQTISISNKCCSFELSIHQRILQKMHYGFPQKQSRTTVFDKNNNITLIVRNVS